MRVLIQHHPSRAALLPRILAEIPDAQVVTDPEPDAMRDPWRAYAACLRHVAEPRALIIQDDAVPAEGLSGRLDEIGLAWPDRLVCLHVNRHPKAMSLLMAKHHRAGARSMEIRPMPWLPVVAMIWPASLAADCLAWADSRPEGVKRRARSDDSVVGQWAMRRRLRPIALIPSVVEHPDDVLSLMQTRSVKEPRTAAFFCGNVRGSEWD